MSEVSENSDPCSPLSWARTVECLGIVRDKPFAAGLPLPDRESGAVTGHKPWCVEVQGEGSTSVSHVVATLHLQNLKLEFSRPIYKPFDRGPAVYGWTRLKHPHRILCKEAPQALD